MKSLFKPWFIFLGLLTLATLIVFSSFLSGRFYFAYLDIGSDSYVQAIPYAKLLAQTTAREGFTGWSFQIGVGQPTAALLSDLFSWLAQAGGEDCVLDFRLWIYLLKLVLGGSFFYMFIFHLVTRWESAVIASLSYSFCGFMVINGQWEPEATVFVFFPLILWAVVHGKKTNNLWVLPLVLAIALVSGTFFVSVAVSLVLLGLVYIFLSNRPLDEIKYWLVKVLPLTFLGYLISLPYLLPVICQILDSSRVGGDQSMINNLLVEAFHPNSWSLILAEIGGFFHKDIFGIGNNYKGYWNYLEGPGFFIGVLMFIVIPHLWNDPKTSRKVLLLSFAFIVCYLLFPFLRFATMGFAAPYFRTSSLWVTLLLLVLAARAVDHIIDKSVDGRLLAIGIGVFAGLLAFVVYGKKGGDVWWPHVDKLLWLSLLAVTVLLLASRKILTQKTLPLALLSVVFVEIVMMARPSYVEGRVLVTPRFNAYDDGSLEALRVIRDIDKGVYRIEKTFNSLSLTDSVAQDYMGVKSYFFHSKGLVDFYTALCLIPGSSLVNNYTNWLPNMGERFMLNSLLGVKYIIAREKLQWPGFIKVGAGQNYQIYRNELAFPLGIVQSKQITQETFSKLFTLPQGLANDYRDIVMMNAVVVKDLMPAHGNLFDFDQLVSSKQVSLDDRYIKPATTLQTTGLKIQTFASNHIKGTISPGQDGILVFSIPFNQGWTLWIDGVATPMIRANFGMLAAPVFAGTHTVELRFQLPGQQTGLWLGLLGLCLMACLLLYNRKRKSCNLTVEGKVQ